MKNGFDTLIAAAPLRVPVSNGATTPFFDTLITYMDDGHFLRILHDSFGSDQTAQFLSIFHGYTIAVQSKKFWTRNFRNVHIYLELAPIVRTRDKLKWRTTVLRLSALYVLHPTNIIALYKSVRDKLKEKRTANGTPKHPPRPAEAPEQVEALSPEEGRVPASA